MPALQIIALDTTTPQLRAPAGGDTYSAPRAIELTPETLTGSTATSSLAITQTWNTTGTPTAINLNVTDTASNAASLLMDLRVGGSSQFSVSKAGVLTLPAGASNSAPSLRIGSNVGLFSRVSGSLNFGGIGNFTIEMVSGEGLRMGPNQIGWGTTVGSVDLILARDAANTLAQRNGVNAQAFRMYETFTDASNYSRLNIDYSGGQWRIIPSGAGTGDANRGLLLGPNGQGAVIFQTNNTTRWLIGASTGHLLANADNTYDIGSSGASRPRNLFLAAYQEMSEMTAPAAPATNSVRIYAEDNGSGKTRLMALFATGAAQQIAIEP